MVKANKKGQQLCSWFVARIVVTRIYCIRQNLRYPLIWKYHLYLKKQPAASISDMATWWPLVSAGVFFLNSKLITENNTTNDGRLNNFNNSWYQLIIQYLKNCEIQQQEVSDSSMYNCWCWGTFLKVFLRFLILLLFFY